MVTKKVLLGEAGCVEATARLYCHLEWFHCLWEWPNPHLFLWNTRYPISAHCVLVTCSQDLVTTRNHPTSEITNFDVLVDPLSFSLNVITSPCSLSLLLPTYPAAFLLSSLFSRVDCESYNSLLQYSLSSVAASASFSSEHCLRVDSFGWRRPQ